MHHASPYNPYLAITCKHCNRTITSHIKKLKSIRRYITMLPCPKASYHEFGFSQEQTLESIAREGVRV